VTDLLPGHGSSRRRRSAELVGLAMGALAAGAAAGVAVERIAVRRALGRDDPMEDEPFGTLRGAPYPVTASDGVALHVEIDEPHAPDGSAPPVTVVLCHGYALNLDSWHFQRRDLRDVARLVLWDQRSHGRSGRSTVAHATLEQTGRDLGTVIDEVAPDGPLVLVGHSMGGMSIMNLAEQRPALFEDRVAAVGLLATSAAGLTDLPAGLRGIPGRVVGRLLPGVVSALGRRAAVVERGRALGHDLSFALTRRYSFASDVPPSYVEWTSDMLAATPIDVVADFFPDFDKHDRLAALAALRDVETLVMVGRQDKVTPLKHSEAIADELPNARLVVLEDCGHMLVFEHHDVVTDALHGLVERATEATGKPNGGRRRGRRR
jgi:pimeloyl-ACP methyl ester carboxylesterase